jgi:hypothetical protein
MSKEKRIPEDNADMEIFMESAGIPSLSQGN